MRVSAVVVMKLASLRQRGDEMNMKMLLDARPRCRAEIDPHIESIRVKSRRHRRLHALQYRLISSVSSSLRSSSTPVSR